jgi:malonyl-CoA decarboxylase
MLSGMNEVNMKPLRSMHGLQAAPSFLSDLIDTLTERGRSLLRQKSDSAVVAKDELPTLGESLLSRRGEASGVALAQALLANYVSAEPAERLAFLQALADCFGPDRDRIELAIEAIQKDSSADSVESLHAAAEPRRQELIRRLNLAPGGTIALVRMREELLGYLPDHPGLKPVDVDFIHLFSSWFNRGFLVLRPIDWNTPANILEKIIRYEAVHTIQGWHDLRNRLEPGDRRCYAFFHPQLVEEPLIFVEVALTKDIPDAVAPLLDLSRQPITDLEATTAVFYSISSTQKGLSGISFGNFLIKQVVENLKRELPNLKTFVTLSPVPGFARWLERELKESDSTWLPRADKDALHFVGSPDWHIDAGEHEQTRNTLLRAAAHYLLKAKDSKGRPVDAVARFHLGNGARLERLNFLGDLSSKGLQQSHGLMVNYLYDLNEIETNHEAFAENGLIAASSGVRRSFSRNPVSQDPMPFR